MKPIWMVPMCFFILVFSQVNISGASGRFTESEKRKLILASGQDPFEYQVKENRDGSVDLVRIIPSEVAARKHVAESKLQAEKGDPEAQWILGHCYDNGIVVSKDKSEAVKWYLKAGEQGYAQAQIELGYYYASDIAIAKDMDEAAKWWRKAAEQGNATAQVNFGFCYQTGSGVTKDANEALKWYRKAAEKGTAEAEYNIGNCYANGEGEIKDLIESVKWYHKAADHGLANAQSQLGFSYLNGIGVIKDYAEAVKWFFKAANHGDQTGQGNLGFCYANGLGLHQNFVKAYMWGNLCAAQGNEDAKKFLSLLEMRMSKEQIAEGQRLTREFKPSEGDLNDFSSPNNSTADNPYSSGTGFFITEDGFLLTNEHVVKNSSQIRLMTKNGSIVAKLVKADLANDIALLKAEGKFSALPVISSRMVRLGNMIATVGFPNVGLQGFAPKLAKGEIAGVSGTQDDPRYFQISAPVQPGNSGGALVDERGNVIGIVSAKLNASAALATSGALPENVNYAVKSSFILSFLESFPEVSAKLKEPISKTQKFEDVVKTTEQSTVLIVVY